MAQDPTDQASNRLLEQFSRQAAAFTNTSLSLPQRVDETLTQLEQGDLRMRVSAVEINRELRQLNRTGRGIIYAVLTGAVLLCATQLFIANLIWVAVGMAALGIVPGIALLRLLRQQRY